MSRNQPCFCGSGLKTKKCHPDIESNSAFANLIRLYKDVDTAIADKAGSVKCRKGCYFCCHEHFNISPIEFYYIMYNIYKRDGMDKVLELTEKGYKFWNDFKAKYPEDAANLEANATGRNFHEKGAARLFMGIEDDRKRFSETPCIFLDDETKSCSIYEFRPFICRVFGVGYTIKMDIPFGLCELIQDGLEYQKEMVDLTDYRDREVSLTVVPVKDFGVVLERGYPFFYFFKIQYGKIDVTLKKIDEYKKFSHSEVISMKIQRMLK